MKKFTTFLVTRRNDGTPVSEAERAEILRSAAETFGGYTLVGLQRGAWVGPDGVLYEDETERLEIVGDDQAAAEEWVKWVCQKLDQKAMYFEVHASDVKFL